VITEAPIFLVRVERLREPEAEKRKMTDKWIGKTAVVTGASVGIGAAIFKEFARSGINVIGLARRSEKVDEIIKELGATKGKAFAHKCDVSDPKSVTETFKWIEEKFGVVHILINNAGIARSGNFLDDSDETWQKMNEIIDTNVRGLTQCTRKAFKLMKKSDDYGLIVNINSILGHRVMNTRFSMNMYPPSKFAVTAISETIRQELVMIEHKKVRVTVS
jgi:NADP+-dependent farnesol dehydrogenase